jgi:hypothetical protein
MSASAIQFRFPLAMKPASGKLREPAAWFIAGDDPAMWIDEMIRWQLVLFDARLYLIPTGVDDANPCGVLVVLKTGKPNVTTALPYALLSDRLYVPADATLDPELSSQEIRDKLLWNVQVLHPSAGLIGFDSGDVITIDALISAPPRQASDWTVAEAGIAPHPPLVSVVGQAMPSMEEILDMGRDGIGSEAEEDLPRLPDESPVRDAMGRTINAGLRPLASAVLRILSFRFSKTPKPPKQPKGTSKTVRPAKSPGVFRQWLMRKVNAMTAASQELRNREINRLLGLLQKDPDIGLQFALPLHTIATRGLAPPSNSLGLRSVNFDLANLFGGNRPGDTWAVPEDLQRQLKKRYREAANRELNLGRFSRAAYIFAHLIGDFTAAADALKRGRSFREASVIYKEKLNNPKAAADCLAEGGLLFEAIPLYRSLGIHETAGDLHVRLDQKDEARECYTVEVGHLTNQKNFIGAARILEKKLNQPDDALALLASTWPDSDSGGVCLREWFSLCGRLGRHADANSRVAALREPRPKGQITTLVRGLGTVAVSYPNPAIRAVAADSVRVLSGYRMSTADAAERQALVKAVVALVPADHLLARDGNRFLSSQKVKPEVMPIPVKGTIPSFVRSFLLPRPFEYRAVVSLPGGYLAFGATGMQATVVRGMWDGRMNHTVERHEATPGAYSFVAPGPGSAALVAQFWPSNVAVGPFKLPRIDLFRDELMVETPQYVHTAYVGICRDEAGTCWVASRDDDGELSLAANTDLI